MPVVKMELSVSAYKEFKMMMKRIGYSDEDLFMKYCALKTIKPHASKADQKLIAQEIASIRKFEKK
jgi:hypothetical protein